VASGAAVYTFVANLGPEWSFKGVGDFLGDGKDDFLIQNSAGAVVVGSGNVDNPCFRMLRFACSYARRSVRCTAIGGSGLVPAS